MTLVVVGVSHKTAGVELRGKLAVPADRLRADLSRLLANDEVSEAVVLSTCNRTEAYAVVLAAPKGVRAIVETLRRNAGLNADGVRELDRALVVKQGPGAVEHLFRVVSSLDSLVLGEAQIIGQVRRAFAAAEDAGAVGETTRRLFRSALEVGKRVREETAIGERPVSVSTAAVQLAERALGELRGRRALVVGTGEMGLLALSYLEERGVSDIVVANRTFERAEEAAARVGGTPAMLDELGERLAQADLVVACAGGEDVLIARDALARAVEARGADASPIVVVDVGLPRTVDPACADVAGAVCFDLDDLDAAMAENARSRAAESVRAEALVARQTDAFLAWMQERDVIPTVKQMHGKARGVCASEAARAAKALAALHGVETSEEERAVLEALASAVAKKLLHGPAARLRKQAGDPDAYRYTEAARYLFGLDAYPQGFSCRSDEGRTCRLVSGSACARHGGDACPHHREERSCIV